MARTISGSERSLLAGAFGVHALVEVQNDNGTWVDLTALDGINFLDSLSFGEDIDTPIAGATIRLARQVAAVSLAPLVEGSAANVDDLDAYAPLLNGGRGIRIHTACTLPGVAPVSGDWKHVFEGKIDEIDSADSVITVTCRDLGARLMDTFIEDEVIFAEPADPVDEGVILEDVIQSVIDSNSVPGSPQIVTPAASNFLIRPYRQSQQPVFEAARTLALQRGWDFRYRHGSDDVYAPMLVDPDRANTTPDFTIPPSEYLDVSELRLGDADIRNKIRIAYLDRDSGDVEDFIKQDDDSIAVYGVRFMEIAEASSSAIDTDAEAEQLADAVLDDLSTPYATHQIDLPYFWPVQLHDIIALPENFVHYDVAQIMGVVAISHTLENGTGRTTIKGRGKPAGAFMEWLKRAGEGRRGTDLDKRIPVLLNFKIKSQTATTRTYSWARGSLVAQVWVGMATFTVDELETVEPWPVVAQNAVNTPHLGDAVNEITVLLPKDGEMFFMQVEPRGADLFAGEVRRVQIEGTPAPFEYQAIATEHTDGTAKVEVTIDDPRGVISTVRFWRTVNNIRTGPIAATTTANPVWSYAFAQHPKHATLIQIEFVRNDGEDNLWSDVFSFDRDDVPEIQSVNVSYALDEATVIVDGDTDTDSLWYDEDIGGVLQGEVELTYRGDMSDPRFGFFTATADPDVKRLFRVYAKNADGDVGVYREVEIDRYQVAVVFLQASADQTDVDADTYEVTVSALSPIGGSPTVKLVALSGGATIASGAALDTPVAAPAVWVFNRTEGLGLPSWAKFEAELAGAESDFDSIAIPEKGQDTIPLKLRAFPLVSTDPLTQLIRVIVAEPGRADVASITPLTHLSLSYTSEGVGAITHTNPAGGAGGSTTNPQSIPYVNSALVADSAGLGSPGGQQQFNYVDFTIARPAFGSDPGRISFLIEDTAADFVPDAEHTTILPVDRKQIQVDIEQIDQDAEEVEVEVTVTDPAPIGGNYIDLAVTKSANVGTITPSGSGDLPSGGTRSFLIPLTAFRSGKGQVIFTATATDRVAGSNFIDIPEVPPDPAGNLTLAIDEAGGLDANVQGDSEVKSWLWLATNSAMPDDATVISTGNLVNARDLALDDMVVVPNPGRGFFKAIPYYFTGAVGDPGLPLSGYADRADTIGAPLIALADPDEGGDVDWDLSGHSSTASYRLLFGSSPPSEAAIRAVTAVNAQSASGSEDADLDFGDELHAGAFAYSAVDGGGTESPVARAVVKRQNATVSKTLRIPASAFAQFGLGLIEPGGDGAYIQPENTIGNAVSYFNLGPGCNITGWEMVSLVSAAGSQKVEAVLRRTDGTGGKVDIDTLTNSGSGGAFATQSDTALDEDTGTNAYMIIVHMDWTSASGTQSRFAEVAIHYDAPDLTTTV